ncbi:MAG: GNAT family N-acetyltransferase [Candidatus Kapabacteria bacterium]|nr:GNAT family N-acetyltransferase [Candidatus Kapabacteria bacterium]
MTPELTIRPLEIDDFATFLDIQREALLQSPELFGSDYEWFESLSILSKEQRYEKYMNFPYQYILGAVDDDGNIAGMIGYSSEDSSKTRHKGTVWGLFVRPEFRGKGIATIMVMSVLETAQDMLDVEQVQLAVSTHNEASYGLYLRLGFKVFGTELHAMKIGDSYVDEYHMVKFLK